MKISVIITSYNYGQYISEAINSVLSQTFRDFELIIVDDASEDNSFDIISDFSNQDSRIKVIKNPENMGLSRSIQRAIDIAGGDWIAFLESDDVWQKNYLEKKIFLIEKFPSCGLIYNNVELIGECANKSSKKYSSIIERNSKMVFPKNMFYDFGYENPILTMSSVMVKKEYLSEADFHSPVDKLLDWYLYIQITSKTSAYYIDEKLTKWRQHDESYINKNRKIKFKFANIAAYAYVYKKQPYNLKLLAFIMFSTIRMCYKRARVIFGF